MATVSNRRAIVTGMGISSPIGDTLDEFCRALMEGTCGIETVEAFDTSPFRCHVAGEHKSFQPTALSEEQVVEIGDRYLHLALESATRALEMAKLPPHFEGDRRVAVVTGTCNGGLRTGERLYRILFGLESGQIDEKMNHLFRNYTMGNALATHFGIGGTVQVVTTACSSSTNALGVALDLIQDDRADLVLAGGADSLCLTTYSGFNAVLAMTADTLCKPFSGDVGEYGMNLGEGAAFWVLETPERARARGVAAQGEVLGYALSGDAYHLTSPDPRGDGAYRAMHRALERAGVSVAELGSINAHGTGTEANDRAESKAIARLLHHAGHETVPVCSTKSFFGHCLGAAGAMEATASLVSMQQGFIPPTLRFDVPRPGCTLDYVPNHSRQVATDCFLSNNFAFAGNNASVVVGSPGRMRQMDAVAQRVQPSSRRRVVVTGAGVVSAAGVGLDALDLAVQNRESAIGPVTRFDTSGCNCDVAGLLEPFHWRSHAKRLDLRTMNTISRFATLAAREALESANLTIRPNTMHPIGLVLGVLVGAPEEVLMRRVWGSEDRAPDINKFSEIVANSTNGHVSRALYLKGYNTTVCPGHQSAVSAALVGAQAICLNHVDQVVVGGADELYEQYFRNHDAVSYLADGKDPFGEYKGRRRILGEGAAMLFLEERELALARNAPILGEILGWASAMDPGRFAEPAERYDGLLFAIREALRLAECGPHDIGAVVWAPMGNSCDEREQRALLSLWGGSSDAPTLQIVPVTGYSESCSALTALALLLRGSAWSRYRSPLGAVASQTSRERVLLLGTSFLGNNYVAVLGV